MAALPVVPCAHVWEAATFSRSRPYIFATGDIFTHQHSHNPTRYHASSPTPILARCVPGNPFPEELRKLLFLSVQALTELKNIAVGYSSGEVLGISQTGELNPPTPTWALSGQVTGYHSVVLPARTWDSGWLENYTNASNGPEMNVTTRVSLARLFLE